jgi:hypothetical protein
MNVKAMLFTAAVGAAAYVAIVRPRIMRWGASDDEIARPMLGDDQVERPIVVTNRAVSIDASPEDVWPWLAQMGELPRGGFYSYEWVERLMGMKVENTDRILPEFQRTHTGDVLDRGGNMTVRAIEPGHTLVLGPPPGLWLDSTWAMAVYPAGEGRSRLVSRVRAQVKRWTPAALMLAIIDPGQFIMERKFLIEIKQRAEALAAQRVERQPVAV